MADIVAIEQVVKRYAGQFTALDRLSLTIGRGEMAFITGASGAGKSTLIKLVGLIERPTSGRVVVNDTDLATVKPAHVARYRQRLGLIFQGTNLLYDRSVFANVALPLRIRGVSRDIAERNVRAALTTVGLANAGAMQPAALSGGEQQRVAIARAVVDRPHLLLADEPTGNLDPALSADILTLFRRLNQSGTSVLIVTHAIDLVARMDVRRIHLEHGRLGSA